MALRTILILLFLGALGAPSMLEHSICYCKGYGFAGWARTMIYYDDNTHLASSWVDTCDAPSGTRPHCFKEDIVNKPTCLATVHPDLRPNICYRPYWWYPHFSIGKEKVKLGGKHKTVELRTDCTEQCRRYLYGEGRDLQGAPLTSACNFTTGGANPQVRYPKDDWMRCRTETWDV